MPKLTSDQMFQLAQSFHTFAREYGDYRFAEWDNLTAAQRRTLEDNERLMRNFSSTLNGLSLKLELDDLQGTLDSITKASGKLRKALKNLANLNQALNIAAIIISLGSAVVTANVAGILTGVDRLVDVL